MWIDTIYAWELIAGAYEIARLPGQPDDNGLNEIITNAEAATQEWGGILSDNPDGGDVQSLLEFIAPAHATFDEAISSLERAMRNLSKR